MRIIKVLSVGLLLAVAFGVVPVFAAGPYVHFVGGGSSAMFQGFEVATVNDVAPTVAACVNGVGAGANQCTIHHYSIKTSDCATCANLHDDRSSGGGAPGAQYG